MNTSQPGRRSLLVTGACGGIGGATARLLGRRYDLILTDNAPDRLDRFAATLRDEGYSVPAALAGDVTQPSFVAGLAEAVLAVAPRLGALVHAAGLSPSMAGWEAILTVNLVATERLLGALEPLLGAGSAAVLMGSIAGHIGPVTAEVDAILAEPLDDAFLRRIGPHLEALGNAADPGGLPSLAYQWSKRAVIRLCERRAPAWGARQARIVSVSPGTIYTPMGRKEVETRPSAGAVIEATPLKRWGLASDIANAVEFLLSDLADFITGTDLRVDGGVVPALAGPSFRPPGLGR